MPMTLLEKKTTAIYLNLLLLQDQGHAGSVFVNNLATEIVNIHDEENGQQA